MHTCTHTHAYAHTHTHTRTHTHTHTHTGGNQTLLDQTMPSQFSSRDDATVRLPPSVFEMIRRQANVGVFFGRYETATLFPVRVEAANGQTLQERLVCSQVVAATVGENVRVENLTQPVTLALRLQNKSGMVDQHDKLLHRLYIL